MLNLQQIQEFQRNGHVTVTGIYDPQTVDAAIADIETWSREFLEQMTSDQERWYLETGATSRVVLRKLDEPVFHRPPFRRMAQSPQLVEIVEQILGAGVSVFFSQVFCKSPDVGGPKPVHQDNFYFGPSDLDATLTVWIALDDATVENGCLFYADGSHSGPVYRHVAPSDEPFNLQIPPDKWSDYEMTAAPVPAGAVSLHHGNTWHQSSANFSAKSRRAIAMHFLRNDASLVEPALKYDPSIVVKIT